MLLVHQVLVAVRRVVVSRRNHRHLVRVVVVVRMVVVPRVGLVRVAPASVLLLRRGGATVVVVGPAGILQNTENTI